MPGHEGAKRLRQERWRFMLLLMATPRFAMIFRLRLYFPYPPVKLMQ